MFISIHAPTRGATKLYRLAWCQFVVFQSTLPREERQCIPLLMASPFVFQSTLPREERPIKVTLVYTFKISIHAPTRGATRFIWYRFKIYINFNPRSHERSDQFDRKLKQQAQKISIHAPTRGATVLNSFHSHLVCISIHAPTRGATAILHKKFVYFYTIPTINI